MLVRSFAVLGIALLGACATPSGVQKASRAEFDSITREHAKACTTIEDDALEVAIKFSSEPCYKRKNGILKEVWDDSFLRAFKARNGGTLTFQVYAVMYYKDWLFPQSANFGAAGLRSIRGERISSNVDCGLYTALGYCTHVEHFIFNLPFEELVEIEQRAAKDPSYKMWTYRIKTQSGIDINRVFNVNEMLGFLDAVTSYKAHQ